MAVPAFSVYLFDVDGTLVDSAHDICGAIQTVLAGTDCADISHEFLRGYIGRHLIDLFQDVFPRHTPEEIEQLIAEYRRVYPARDHGSTRVFAGVIEALRTLGGRKATATTKGTPTTRMVLEKFGLLPYFNHVQGTDGFPAKPNPDVIYAALTALDAKPEDCLFVGDSTADMEAARRAGVTSCAVTYGYGCREDMARWRPDFWISDLRELVD
ncbi:MAG TPA: HAD family hydrolase [Bryobacteraceae bacterium]|nr:HAD family hydrolase [Bryobacteraceae bacterium]